MAVARRTARASGRNDGGGYAGRLGESKAAQWGRMAMAATTMADKIDGGGGGAAVASLAVGRQWGGGGVAGATEDGEVVGEDGAWWRRRMAARIDGGGAAVVSLARPMTVGAGVAGGVAGATDDGEAGRIDGVQRLWGRTVMAAARRTNYMYT
ncbi:hypothetical protein OsI_02214 [Oryza sativa Indica Group]|uniref:Uncharacterized protein n=1 Tax=Oryza sativa subsp. indica TaxID=39946 RepID=A2WQT0_ORYSI|nr:hypothetical protein OsI_02214 [Oryza sativa Indica Group]